MGKRYETYQRSMNSNDVKRPNFLHKFGRRVIFAAQQRRYPRFILNQMYKHNLSL